MNKEEIKKQLKKEIEEKIDEFVNTVNVNINLYKKGKITMYKKRNIVESLIEGKRGVKTKIYAEKTS